MSDMEFGEMIPINMEKRFERKLGELIDEYKSQPSISIYEMIDSLKYYIRQLYEIQEARANREGY